MTKARSNAVAEAAKGDLSVGTGTNLAGILAIGSNGDTLVADSSASTGLRYQGNFAAGKNKIINGDMAINQRNFSSTTTPYIYGIDRFNWGYFDGTCTYSVQQFTTGAAPVVGYEAKQYARIVTTGQTTFNANTIFNTSVENVRNFANQTMTLSFWAKAASGTPKIALEVEQNFGTGGSPSSIVQTYGGQVTLSTSWARYSLTVTMPSISGKTIGTNENTSYIGFNMWTSAGSGWNARTGSLGIQNNTIDIWGVQAEAGSVATAFQTATGTLQGELAACQRYYVQFNAADNVYTNFATGQAISSSAALVIVPLPVPLRSTPSFSYTGDIGLNTSNNGTINNVTGLTLNVTSKITPRLSATGSSGLAAGNVTLLGANNSSAAKLEFSSEL
jgi:hypothetical protein